MKRFFSVLTLAPALALLIQAAPAHGETVLAEVNGEAITERQLNQIIAQQTQGASEVPPAQREQFLEEVINLTVLAQAASEQGLADDPALQAQLENTRRTALAQALVRSLSTSEPISEQALQARYDAEYGSGQLEYRARHILVDNAALAADLASQIRDDGADFAALAAEHSRDGSGANGGDLGWFTASDMVAPFADAVQALDVNEVSETPVETRFGWHVIQVNEVREREAPPLAQVQSELRMAIVNERIQSAIEDLRDGASIHYE